MFGILYGTADEFAMLDAFIEKGKGRIIDVEPLNVTREDRAAEIIHRTQGRIFGAVVRTRSGDLRTFNAKLTPDSFNAYDQQHGQVTVIEINALKAGRGKYRTIALEGVKSVTVDGLTYDLDHEFAEVA